MFRRLAHDAVASLVNYSIPITIVDGTSVTGKEHISSKILFPPSPESFGRKNGGGERGKEKGVGEEEEEEEGKRVRVNPLHNIEKFQQIKKDTDTDGVEDGEMHDSMKGERETGWLERAQTVFETKDIVTREEGVTRDQAYRMTKYEHLKTEWLKEAGNPLTVYSTYLCNPWHTYVPLCWCSNPVIFYLPNLFLSLEMVMRGKYLLSITDLTELVEGTVERVWRELMESEWRAGG